MFGNTFYSITRYIPMRSIPTTSYLALSILLFSINHPNTIITKRDRLFYNLSYFFSLLKPMMAEIIKTHSRIIPKIE